MFFRQDRVGINGEIFRMIKFRSMVVDAESRLEKLQDENRDAGNVVLFKMKNDPRITRVGKFIRRFSIDELPQLFNVVIGDMSLVGPRPPLKAEVDLYGDEARRRLLVKPGMTGLWQVSGRSDLTWDDTVRLDVYYVENWSITGDMVIIWKTAQGRRLLRPAPTDRSTPAVGRGLHHGSAAGGRAVDRRPPAPPPPMHRPRRRCGKVSG